MPYRLTRHLKPVLHLAATWGLLLPMSSAFCEVNWQYETDLHWSQQSFTEGAAQQQSQLQLSSLWQGESWDISIRLPLITMDSAYQLEPGKTPNLCSRIQHASTQKLTRWLRLGRVNQKTIDRCLAQPDTNNDKQVSGVGDARIEANHYWPLSDNLEVSLGAGYKAANGDYEQNLGTGRESIYLMPSASYLWTQVSATVNAEYARHLGTANLDELDTTKSLRAQINWQWHTAWSLGFYNQWDSASFADEDSLISTGVQLAYQPIKQLSLGIGFERYRPNSQDLTQLVMCRIAYTAF